MTEPLVLKDCRSSGTSTVSTTWGMKGYARVETYDASDRTFHAVELTEADTVTLAAWLLEHAGHRALAGYVLGKLPDA